MKMGSNTILITGGASGIGLAMAAAMLRAGNDVVICGRDQAKLDAAAAALPGLHAIRADVADPTSRAALLAEVTARFPALNVLINNAGILHLCDVTQPGFTLMLERETATNLVAPVALIEALLPGLLRQKEAAIVNMTSGYVFLPSARMPCYSATKAGLRAMTRAIRFQLRATAVRVIEVMPPAVDTAMATHYAGAKLQPAVIAKQVLAGLASGRTEIVIGQSRLAAGMARLLPGTAFGVMNRGEARWTGGA